MSTPATAAGLGQAIDRAAGRRLTTPAAVGIIAAIYLLFFANGIFNAIHSAAHHSTSNLEDYTQLGYVQALVTIAAEIPAALVIFYLICRWLSIPRSLAGTPATRLEVIAHHTRRRIAPSVLPAVITVVIAAAGLGFADLVIALITPAESATNSGLAHNTASWFAAIVRCLNAGICEEIVIVAIPVLLGRRAGWHPAVIIAVSVGLRWPFHIYHGLWPSIPWVIIWGGAFAVSYLYLRRLWPLVIAHTINDMISFYTDSGAGQWLILGIVLGFSTAAVIRCLRERRIRRRTITVPNGTSITYRRQYTGTLRIDTNYKKVPDLWAAIQAIRADAHTTTGHISCLPGRNSPQAKQLAVHGFPRRTHPVRRYRIPSNWHLATSEIKEDTS